MAFLPSADGKYLTGRGLAFREAADGSHKGLIFPQWILPTGHFDQPSSDLLILLPAGYPDVAPDMFFLNPWARIASTGVYPRCANVAHAFAGTSWQRWSRHNNEWRSGVDGIWTMLKRVEHALDVAQ